MVLGMGKLEESQAAVEMGTVMISSGVQLLVEGGMHPLDAMAAVIGALIAGGCRVEGIPSQTLLARLSRVVPEVERLKGWGAANEGAGD